MTYRPAQPAHTTMGVRLINLPPDGTVVAVARNAEPETEADVS